MADKKMTELDNLQGNLASEDLLHVVDSPDNAPVNKKVSVENFVGNINKTVGTADAAGKSLTKSTITVDSFTSASGYTGDLVALDSMVSATPGTTSIVTNVYGARFRANAGVAALNTAATSTIAGAYIEADITGGVGTGFNAASRQYGLIVDVNDSQRATTGRAVKPNALLRLSDGTAAENSNESNSSSESGAGDMAFTVSHLMEMANVHLSSNGHAFNESGEGMILRAANGASHTDSIHGNFHKIRFNVNGEDMFLLATSNGETLTT